MSRCFDLISLSSNISNLNNNFGFLISQTVLCGNGHIHFSKIFNVIKLITSETFMIPGIRKRVPFCICSIKQFLLRCSMHYVKKSAMQQSLSSLKMCNASEFIIIKIVQVCHTSTFINYVSLACVALYCSYYNFQLYGVLRQIVLSNMQLCIL